MRREPRLGPLATTCSDLWCFETADVSLGRRSRGFLRNVPPEFVYPDQDPWRKEDFAPLTEEELAKLEVYCFANCANTMKFIRTDVGGNDGRTSVLRAIIGMLAQPRGAPEDVVSALLAMLTEYGTGRDWPRERLAEETARWQHLLTRGPRDAEFAVERRAHQLLRNDRLGLGDAGVGLVIRRLRLIDRRLRYRVGAQQFLLPLQSQLRLPEVGLRASLPGLGRLIHVSSVRW